MPYTVNPKLELFQTPDVWSIHRWDGSEWLTIFSQQNRIDAIRNGQWHFDRQVGTNPVVVSRYHGDPESILITVTGTTNLFTGEPVVLTQEENVSG